MGGGKIGVYIPYNTWGRGREKERETDRKIYR